MQFAERETTTTIGELNVGDFIVLVPTQERTRGVRFDSGIASIVPQRFKRGRSEVVGGSLIKVHRTGVRYAFPNHFKVIVRRKLDDAVQQDPTDGKHYEDDF